MPSHDDRDQREQRNATATGERRAPVEAPIEAPFAKSADDVCAAVDVDPDQGLSDDEARRRLERYGPNALREARTKSPWRILLDQFMSTVIVVLIAADVVAIATARWEEAIAIAAVVLVNAAIGFTTEWRAVRAMNALRVMATPDVRVRRDGRGRSIDESNLVPGDLVVLESGDRVPADLRLLEANGMRIDEASLTGESVAVTKRVDAVDADAPLAERTSMTYRGTLITDGSGEGVVVATGMATELGRISALAESAEAQATPLQRRLDRLGRRLAVLTIVTAVLVATLGLIVGQDPQRMIETAIALGVAAIPEGLPIVATIALARGMWLLARRNALIDRLPAVETLGATQVIFTDKTGTLTENRMTLTRLLTEPGEHRLDEAEGTIDDGDPGDDPGGLDPVVRRLLESGALCTNADASGVARRGPEDDEDASEDESQQGDPTELALLRGAAMVGVHRGELLDDQPEEREVAFDAELMLMATFHRRDGEYRVAVKGAPGAVLERCDRVATGDGDQALSDDERSRWLERSEAMAGEGLRVLGIAEKAAGDVGDEPYEGLVLLGLVGLHDPPRENVRWAVQECREAGIVVILATGDQAATARAIAFQTGIVDDEQAEVMHGSELEDPDAASEEARQRVLATRVFARVDPEQKLRLVETFQADGRVVAMTGDGVNDAPALKTADIGVAMGQRGTDAARQVADMVLQDDAFETIVRAVQQGRVIFGNIRKSVLFMLCTNLAEVVAVAVGSVIAAFIALPLPLLPLQILYLNVLTDVFPALALAVGRGGSEVMNRPPRPRSESILTPDHWRAIVASSLVIAASVLAALAIATFGLGLPRLEAITVSFLTLAFGKLWFTLVLATPGTHPFDNSVVRNPYVWGALALCIPLLLAAVYLPGLAGVLNTAPPGAAGWGLLLAFSAVPFVAGLALRARQYATRSDS